MLIRSNPRTQKPKIYRGQHTIFNNSSIYTICQVLYCSLTRMVVTTKFLKYQYQFRYLEITTNNNIQKITYKNKYIICFLIVCSRITKFTQNTQSADMKSCHLTLSIHGYSLGQIYYNKIIFYITSDEIFGAVIKSPLKKPTRQRLCLQFLTLHRNQITLSRRRYLNTQVICLYKRHTAVQLNITQR